MFGFGMPELIVIAVILVLIVVGLAMRKNAPPKGKSRVGDGFNKINPSVPVLIFACGMLAAFFMPWFQLFGLGVSGYQIGNLGSYGNYAWIVPLFAGGTILISVLGMDNRRLGAFTGFVPLGILVFIIIKTYDEPGPKNSEAIFSFVKHIFSIGAYLTIICSVGIIISAQFINTYVKDSEQLPNMAPDESYRTTNPSIVNDSDTRECPACAETIKAKAIKCKHCGSMLPILSDEMKIKEEANQLHSVTENKPPFLLRSAVDNFCTSCGARRESDDQQFCTKCGKEFPQQ